MISNARWLQRGKPLKFGRGCKTVFAGSDLDPNAEFTDETIEYLFRYP